MIEVLEKKKKIGGDLTVHSVQLIAVNQLGTLNYFYFFIFLHF